MSEQAIFSPDRKTHRRWRAAQWAAFSLAVWAGCSDAPAPSTDPVGTGTGTSPVGVSGSGAPVAAPAAGVRAPVTTPPTTAPVPGQAGQLATPTAGIPGTLPPSAGAAGTLPVDDTDAGVPGAAGTGAAGTSAAGTGAAGTAGAAAGATGSAGAAGSGTSPTSAFKRGCKNRELGPCASFIPENGKELELGPYGALMEVNVGKGFEYPVASGDSDNNASCRSFTSLFGEDPESTKMLLDVSQLDMKLFTVYRPAQFKEGEKVPIITWGNGTCSQPEGYGALLRYVASHGFLVVAANSRWVGDGGPMKKGLDFAFAANEDKNSPYYQKLDTTKVGAMGHSQGGQGTVAVVGDSRVKAVILWNSGASTSKPFLAVSGDKDIVGLTASSMERAVNSARVKAAYLYYHMIPGTGSASGHLTLMTQPERVAEPAVAWWKLILSGDAASKPYFVGTDCKLCKRDSEFEFGQKGLE